MQSRFLVIHRIADVPIQKRRKRSDSFHQKNLLRGNRSLIRIKIKRHGINLIGNNRDLLRGHIPNFKSRNAAFHFVQSHFFKQAEKLKLCKQTDQLLTPHAMISDIPQRKPQRDIALDPCQKL